MRAKSSSYRGLIPYTPVSPFLYGLRSTIKNLHVILTSSSVLFHLLHRLLCHLSSLDPPRSTVDVKCRNEPTRSLLIRPCYHGFVIQAIPTLMIGAIHYAILGLIQSVGSLGQNVLSSRTMCIKCRYYHTHIFHIPIFLFLRTTTATPCWAGT